MKEKVFKQKIDYKHLFGTNSSEHYRENIEKGIQSIKHFLNRDDFYSGITVFELEEKMKKYSVETSKELDINTALKAIDDLYISHAISFHSPNYIAHLNCPVLIPALVGDLIASAINTAVETWDQSTSATLIEKDLIKWIYSRLGLPNSSDGLFTSGGTQSNLMGILMARDSYAEKYLNLDIKKNGGSNHLSKFRIFCSEKSHFSIQKSAAILGMGYNAVIPIETDSNFKMSPEKLILAIENEKKLGNIPIAIVATAGTTDFGSIDPIKTLRRIANKHSLWLHTDAAYGGSFIVSKKQSHLLEGIESSDSVTIDFHKSFFQPVCSSVFLTRDKINFKYVSHYANYLNPKNKKESEFINLVDKSIQTTRRFDALKMWFTLKITTEKTVGLYLEKICELTQNAYNLLNEYGCFEIANKPQLTTVVFRFILKDFNENKTHDLINLHIKQTLFKSGEAGIASTKINGNLYLKFTILNPQLKIEDIKNIIEMIIYKGKNYGKKN
ncbi:L-2,4-diaminobutyrate decarboxylase [Wenyingzhuangia heitensis]|uniref:L-2,4-diaminobutyrate decarboxylase n=1 Tax=Wenyingzhuangia heitensis TaxID=1487859 RepID=A0ABX0UBD2_9FLAO|nr:aspartate aminotransferase family protein [Wenyingzhuangia heitensis]NIJ44461.1 L-2,4-diaminobutyrate decarboxylase [Wenyingzhuangia heitensis]